MTPGQPRGQPTGESHDRPAGQPSEPTTDSLFGALFERGRASVDAITSTAQLALAEARLAASSAGLLLLIGVVLVAILLIVWVLLMALLGIALHAAGLGVGWVLGVLLLLHLLLGAGLGWIAVRLLRHLSFRHTREAVALQRKAHDRA